MTPCDARVISINSGWYHTLAVLENGTIMGWGWNAYHQLDYTTNVTNIYVLTALRTDNFAGGTLPNKTFASVGAGLYFSLAVTDNGEVYIWGSADDGQFINGIPYSDAPPTRIGNLTNIVTADGGLSHVLMLNNLGEVYAVGENNAGQCGDGTTIRRMVDSPVKVVFPFTNPGEKIIRAEAGVWNSIALSDYGTIFVWGIGEEIAGRNPDNRTWANPLDVTGCFSPNEKIMELRVGHATAILKTNLGKIYAWGRGDLGSIGNGNNISYNYPVPVDMSGVLNNHTFGPLFGIGNVGVVAVSEDNTIFGWGWNYYKEIDPTNNFWRVLSPIYYYFGNSTLLYQNKSNSNGSTPVIVDLSVGGDHVTFVLSNGDVICSGFSGYGVLGASNYYGSGPVKAEFPVNGEIGPWGPCIINSSTESLPPSQQQCYSIRSCIGPKYGGYPCPAFTTIQACDCPKNDTVQCPIQICDCNNTNGNNSNTSINPVWSDWSSCSGSCNGNTQRICILGNCVGGASDYCNVGTCGTFPNGTVAYSPVIISNTVTISSNVNFVIASNFVINDNAVLNLDGGQLSVADVTVDGTISFSEVSNFAVTGCMQLHQNSVLQIHRNVYSRINGTTTLFNFSCVNGSFGAYDFVGKLDGECVDVVVGLLKKSYLAVHYGCPVNNQNNNINSNPVCDAHHPGVMFSTLLMIGVISYFLGLFN